MAQPVDPVRAQAFGFEVHDPQKFAQNMARLVEETGKAVSAFVEPRVTDPTRALMPDDLTRIMNAFAQVQHSATGLCGAPLSSAPSCRAHARSAQRLFPIPRMRASRTLHGRRTSTSIS